MFYLQIVAPGVQNVLHLAHVLLCNKDLCHCKPVEVWATGPGTLRWCLDLVRASVRDPRCSVRRLGSHSFTLCVNNAKKRQRQSYVQCIAYFLIQKFLSVWRIHLSWGTPVMTSHSCWNTSHL